MIPSNFCNSQSIGDVVMIRVQKRDDAENPEKRILFWRERDKSSFMCTDSTAFYSFGTSLVSLSTHDPNKTERSVCNTRW